jgi:hypothetical protein
MNIDYLVFIWRSSMQKSKKSLKERIEYLEDNMPNKGFF